MILGEPRQLLRRNTQRKGKNLWTSREGGSLIGYYEAPDGRMRRCSSPTAFSKAICARQAKTDHQPRCAVLYRTNSQSRLVEEALRRYQIQYHMVGGFRLLRPRRGQGHAQLSEAGAEPTRFHRTRSSCQFTAARDRQDDHGHAGAHCSHDRHEHMGCSCPRDGREAVAGARTVRTRQLSQVD